MGKRKIGIITMYYKSNNYGGLLQAYALPTYINKTYEDIYAEQITYSSEVTLNKRDLEYILDRMKGCSFRTIIQKIIEREKRLINEKKQTKEFEEQFLKRKERNSEFRECIPHSSLVKGSTERLNEEYDIFITGSDQVWSPYFWGGAYFLDFVKKEKKKFSYAASMATNRITEKTARKIIPLIERFDYISVRENVARNILKQYINSPEIYTVVDPVFLLDVKEWDKIANEVIKDKTYIYAYLLGDDKFNVKTVNKIKDLLQMPIATVPYIHMRNNGFDASFGDMAIYDAGPKEFVGLIKNAHIIVTDSFHAIVFSIIYKKQFLYLKRDRETDSRSANCRILDMLEELNLSNRVVTSKKEISITVLKNKIDYEKVEKLLKEKIDFSKRFIEDALYG